MPRNRLPREVVTPIGVIEKFSGESVPSGHLFCDGRIVSILRYPKLFAVIGFTNGNGNNDGLTFHIPDLRGRFLRGVDEGSGRDVDSVLRTSPNTGGNSGDNTGSVQGDTIRNLEGVWSTAATGVDPSGAFTATNAGRRETGDEGAVNPVIRLGADSVVPTGEDNRPANVYVKMMIRVD